MLCLLSLLLQADKGCILNTPPVWKFDLVEPPDSVPKRKGERPRRLVDGLCPVQDRSPWLDISLPSWSAAASDGERAYITSSGQVSMAGYAHSQLDEYESELSESRVGSRSIVKPLTRNVFGELLQ